MIKRVIMQYLVFYLNTHFNAVTICVNSNFAELTTYILVFRPGFNIIENGPIIYVHVVGVFWGVQIWI